MVANDLESRADNGTTARNATHNDNGETFGYRGLSNFLDSNREFLVFRRFGRLNVRNILYLQDELCELQEQLDRRDDFGGNGGATRRDEKDLERLELMNKCRSLLREYNDALLSYSRIIDLGDASDRQAASVKNWLQREAPVVHGESLFLKDKYLKGRREDLLALGTATAENDVIARAIENNKHLRKLFITESHMKKSLKPEFDLYGSRNGIRRTARGVMLLICWLLLVVPILILYEMKNRGARIWVTVGFMVAFSGGMTLLTNAKNWEIMAACAAYAAVLVVFLGNSQ
ncbi:hypothetical protein K440DRAFT_326986 [Wilcoxina mikolae CBS 423.85]|nr:hypothetical protein K440DRAFT_326986 [Wilcoxina mikolae CBS 423.85]